MSVREIDVSRWTGAERVLACSALTVPFAFGWLARSFFLTNDPLGSPYVSREFMAINVPFLTTQAIGHVLLVLIALAVRSRGQRTTPWLVHLEVQFWMLCASFSLYSVGPFTSSFSVLILALPVLGYLLFDAKIMHLGLATLVSGVSAGMILPQLGILPYGPVFSRSPVESGHLDAVFLLTYGLPSVFVASLVITIHVHLVRALHERTRDLERASRTDGLTGLANRSVFFDRLAEETARSRRSSAGLSAMMIDVDHFKRVNDTLGHAEGDKALVSVADSIRVAVRSCDVVARYGGEEFAVILPDTTRDEALHVGGRVLERCRELAYGPSDDRRELSVSIGIAAFDGVESADDLVARADAALYASKHEGRDRITFG